MGSIEIADFRGSQLIFVEITKYHETLCKINPQRNQTGKMVWISLIYLLMSNDTCSTISHRSQV